MRMKTLTARGLVAFLLSVMVTLGFAGEFHSVIITSSPLVVNVNDDRVLRVWNFTQEGGIQRGVVTVTTSGGTANVLTASIIDASTSSSSSLEEPINKVVIAGPAQVTVSPVTGATLFITYRKELDEANGNPSATVTPTPTATATPTPTATPAPTPTP
jgi:hypothetical protein